MLIEKTKEWFETVFPEPTIDNASVQMGVHIEEISEMGRTLFGDVLPVKYLEQIANNFKQRLEPNVAQLTRADKEQLLDDMVDQIVTSVGVCHTLGLDVLGALEEVNRANFSKFEDGKPVFDDNGKLAKGKDYVRPDLSSFIH